MSKSTDSNLSKYALIERERKFLVTADQGLIKA